MHIKKYCLSPGQGTKTATVAHLLIVDIYRLNPLLTFIKHAKIIPAQDRWKRTRTPRDGGVCKDLMMVPTALFALRFVVSGVVVGPVSSKVITRSASFNSREIERGKK